VWRLRGAQLKRSVTVPNSYYRHWWLYLNLKPGEGRWQHVGKRFYGVVFHRWPLIAAFVDDTWYEPATTAGVCLLGFVEAGVFIQHQRAASPQAPDVR
jgi:hypothetical protein